MSKLIKITSFILIMGIVAIFAVNCGGSQKTETNDTTNVVVDTTKVDSVKVDTTAVSGGAGHIGNGEVPTEHKK